MRLTPAMILAILMVIAAAVYMIYVDQKDSHQTVNTIQSDAPMTGEKCQQVAVDRGWSGTWDAINGCLLISPDGSQVEHVGTWKGD